jgi:hypothetical protein
VAADVAARVDDRFGQARRAPRVLQPFLVRLGVGEFERVGGDDFGVELFVLALVVEVGEPEPRADAEVVAAMRADL